MRLLEDLRVLVKSPLARRAVVSTAVGRVFEAARTWRASKATPGRPDQLSLRWADTVVGRFCSEFDPADLLGSPLPTEVLESRSQWLLHCSELTLEHRIDLGGPEWVGLAPEDEPPGFLGIRHSDSPRARIAQLLAAGASRGARFEADDFQSLQDGVGYAGGPLEVDRYRRIPWDRDPLTGYRWGSGGGGSDVGLLDHLGRRGGAPPGADVRVCWEVARLQHLPLLALAYPLSGPEKSAGLRREFVLQVADFRSANPPGSGIHWASGMEVGIRVANVALALALFGTWGASFEQSELREIGSFLAEHVSFCIQNPDRRPFLTHNHYLVQLAGVVLGIWSLFPAASDGESEGGRLLRGAGEELCRQVCEQFSEEGSHFEGSTGYHLFASQAAAFALGVLVRAAPEIPSLPAALERLALAGEFLDSVTDESGRIPLVGDFDGGRFVVLDRRLEGAGVPVWDRADSLPVLGAVAAVTGFRPSFNPDAARTLDAAVVRSVSGLEWSRSTSPTGEPDAPASGTDQPVLSSFSSRGERSRPRGTGRCAPDWTVVSLVLEGWDQTPRKGRRAWVFTDKGPRAALGAGGDPVPRSFTACDLVETFASADPETEAPVLLEYPSFGLYVYRAQGLFAAVRCGPVGQRGWGGHSHADQLSVSLTLGGRPLLYDPGSFVYGAFPDLRRVYRSARAHNGPYGPGVESLPQTSSLFGAPLGAEGTGLVVHDSCFVGKWAAAGASFWRAVLISADPEVRRRVEGLLPDKRRGGDTSKVPWTVVILDWSEGSPLAESARFPPSFAYGQLGLQDFVPAASSPGAVRPAQR